MYRSAIEHCKDNFWLFASKNFSGPKLPIFDDFATQWHLWGPISPASSMIWARQPENGIGSYKYSPTSSQNSLNFGPLTAKNRTIVFTHPPKSFAWRRRPSRWPALRRTTISSCSRSSSSSSGGSSICGVGPAGCSIVLGYHYLYVTHPRKIWSWFLCKSLY